MPAIVRLIDNTRKSDGSIITELRVTVTGGISGSLEERREILTPQNKAEVKAKNRALLHNGYDKAFKDADFGDVSIKTVKIEEMKDRFVTKRYYIVTEIEGATKFSQ